MSDQKPEIEVSDFLMDPSLRRLAIGDNLKKSLMTKVLAATAVRVDFTRFLSFRDLFKDRCEARFGAPFRLEIFMLQAIVEAIRQFPMLNTCFLPDQRKIKIYTKTNIGLAFAAKAGLLVPVVKDANQKDNAALAKEIERLYKSAESDKMLPRDRRDGTITFNNPGVLGGVDGFSIPPPEQSAIVSLHRIEENNRLNRGWCQEAKLNLVFDHQVCDGREALGFLNSIKSYFESEKYKPR